MSKATKEEKNLVSICGLIKALHDIEKKTRADDYNELEFACLNELIVAKYKGERLISTQLAKRLGVTRSAVSQIVTRLEKKGVIQRVAVKNDKKSLYVELRETALKGELAVTKKQVASGVERFGVEKFETLCALAREFCSTLENKECI